MPKITGLNVVNGKLAQLSGQQKISLVGQALVAGGQEIKAEAARSITAGAVSGKDHVPSAPGEPPNENTGVLRSNIEVTQPAPLRVEISSNAPYSAALENGTSKMQARPFMGPAARKAKASVIARVNKVIDKLVKG